MNITRKSPFSGNINTLDLDITQDQLDQWNNGGLAQYVFPDLTPGEREFLMTGITDAEWNGVFEETD